MLLNYQYKILPSVEQKARMKNWLEMLRHQYNYLLAERFEWWESNRCPIDYCSLVQKAIQLKDKPDYYGQKRSLVQLKAERVWYKDVQSQVLQDMVKRVDLAFQRFLKGDVNGKRSGRPRFKGKNRYRTLKFPTVKAECLQNNKIALPKLGAIKIIEHRPIPDGFTIKNAQVTLKADGWYVSLCIEDKSIPEFDCDVNPTLKNSIGIDVGLEKFLSDSEGGFIANPRHFRSSAVKLAKLQQKFETKKKRSRARKLLYRKIAKLHLKISRQRKQFHYETVQNLLFKVEVVCVEKLNVASMARRCKPKQDDTGKFLPNRQAQKSGMNKSILDAGWGQFIEILSSKAARAGKKVIKVNPSGTSQYCYNCLSRVSKTIADRWHSCPTCGVEIDRDTCSAKLIKKVALGIASLKKAHRSKDRREASTLSTG